MSDDARNTIIAAILSFVTLIIAGYICHTLLTMP